MKFEKPILQVNNINVIRYDLQYESESSDFVAHSIVNLWKEYEPWSTFNDIKNIVTIKPGRMIDIAYDQCGNVVGFYVFRIFQFDSLKIMFRGSSYSIINVRGIGVPLLNLTLKQFFPDRLVTFSNQERVYKLLSYFGEIFPDKDKSLDFKEMKLLSQLVGSKNQINEDSLLIKDFYNDKHLMQGNRVKDEYVRYLFSKLGKRDAYAILVRVR